MKLNNKKIVLIIVAVIALFCFLYKLVDEFNITNFKEDSAKEETNEKAQDEIDEYKKDWLMKLSILNSRYNETLINTRWHCSNFDEYDNYSEFRGDAVFTFYEDGVAKLVCEIKKHSDDDGLDHYIGNDTTYYKYIIDTFGGHLYIYGEEFMDCELWHDSKKHEGNPEPFFDKSVPLTRFHVKEHKCWFQD